MENFKLKDRVIVIGKNVKGEIAYIGETQFAEGVMFGVILDEPKGKYSGTIEDVCYFKCPMNHGTFVRACQLEKDFDYCLADWSRPAYPNYLKETSSKNRFKTEKVSKQENNNSKAKVKTPGSPTKIHVSRNMQLLDEKYQKGDTIVDQIDQPSSSSDAKRNLNDTLEELNIAKQKLCEHEKQMDVVNRYLRMLKTYLKWKEEYEKSIGSGGGRNGNLLQLLMGNAIKKIQEIVSRGPDEKPSQSSNEDSSILKEENNFFQLCIGVLEKKNKVLTESLTHARDILERAWNLSRFQNKCQCNETSNGKDRVENRCEICSSKQSFIDIVEHETRLFLNLNPIAKPKPTGNPNKILEELEGSEKIKKYLEALLTNKKIPNQACIEFRRSKEDKNKQSKDQWKISDSADKVSEMLTHSVREPAISAASNLNSPTKQNIRSTPVPQSQKRPIEKKQKTHPFMNLNVPSKELREFFSEMMSNASEIIKSPQKSSGTTTKSLDKSVQEPMTLEKDILDKLDDSPVQPTSNKAGNASKESGKGKGERKMKWPKSELKEDIGKKK